MCGGFSYRQGIEDWWLYGLIAFFSTFSVYNGQRLFKSRNQFQTPWLKWVDSNKQALYVTVLVALMITFTLVLFVKAINPNALILLAVSSIISMFYVVKLGKRNMREVPHLKIHLIALSWSAILIVFPMLNEGVFDNLLWVAGAHYLYVLGVTIPFDIRDLKYDDRIQKTLPQVLGIEGARMLSLFSLISFSVLMLYIDAELWYNPVFYLAVVVQLTLVMLMNEKRSDWYCAGLIDGAITILGFAYFLP